MMTQRKRIGARAEDTVANRTRIVRVEYEEIQHRRLVGFGIASLEYVGLAEDRQQRRPRLGVARRRFDQQMIIDVHQARAPFGSFEIASGPEEMIGDSAQH